MINMNPTHIRPRWMFYIVNYDQLEHFIHKKMRMTHIYQPIMIRTLLESDGMATTEDIAKQFLGYDSSQINYYKTIVKRWPHITLKKHNIIEYKKDVYKLQLDTIEESQKMRLVELCNLRLHEFIDQDPWIRSMRELDKKSISGSLRYTLLSKARGICVACGSGPPKPLDIDHIVPRSRGGKNVMENFQVLCYQCNREKRDRDELDFVRERKRLQFRKKDCDKCRIDSDVEKNALSHVRSKNGTYLISPNRHVGSFVEMIPAEKNMCISMVEKIIGNDINSFDVKFDVPSTHYSIELVRR